MLWKVIVFLVFLVVALLFIGANYGNMSKISLWWIREVQDVPVFLSMAFAFALGMLAMVPFLIRLRFSQRRKEKALKDEPADKEEPQESPPTPPPA